MAGRNLHKRFRARRRHRRDALPASDALHIFVPARLVRKLMKVLAENNSDLAHAQISEPSLRPTLKPWIGIIDQVVEEEAALPRRLQTTAMSIFKKLREKHGYGGCYNVVQGYVHQARIAANPNYQLRKTRSNPLVSLDVSPASGRRDRPSDETRKPAASLMSLWSRPKRMPEGMASDWMRGIEQKAIPLETLEEQIPDLKAAELEALLTAVRNGTPPIRNRALAVLAYLRGISSAQISSFLNISRHTAFRYSKVYQDGGIKNLFARKPRSNKKTNDESIKSALFALLHSPPAAHGINRTTWRLADLQYVLREESNVSLALGSIGTIIKEAGWKWRHARMVLTSHDPEYRAKVDSIKEILSGLKPDEAFFSIDEFGPFALKKKGGVKRVAPGDQYVVPQWQKSKGWLILTAALELSQNRVTHFFSRKKNTGEMIKMADLLRDKYRWCTTIYLSWDAASWHISKELATHLASLNKSATEEGFPLIKLAPLPAGAQFLNVIESIFSGMARAIIHNSDYPSETVATEAIDRYFEQRNEYFATHPRKAGNKIWGMERVPSQFAEDQNCKDPIYQLPY
jgi:transposase